MSGFMCCFWWFLLGLLAGWLLNWLLSRALRSEPPTSSVSTYVAPFAAAVGGINFAAASAAGFSIKGDDDLQIIEGIGPKISELLKTHGVGTFTKLSAMAPEQISAILEQGGARFKLANPGTWPQQARLCAENRWAELRALQDALSAGIDKSAAH